MFKWIALHYGILFCLAFDEIRFMLLNDTTSILDGGRRL